VAKKTQNNSFYCLISRTAEADARLTEDIIYSL